MYTAQKLAMMSYRRYRKIMESSDVLLRLRALAAHLASGTAAEASTQTGNGPVEVTVIVTWPGGRVKMTAGLESVNDERLRLTERSRWVTAEGTEIVWEDNGRKRILLRRSR